MRSLTGLANGALVGTMVGAVASVSIGLGHVLWFATQGEPDSAALFFAIFATFGLLAGAVVGCGLAAVLGFLLGLFKAERLAPLVAVVASGLLSGAVVLPMVTDEGPLATAIAVAMTVLVLAVSYRGGEYFVRAMAADSGRWEPVQALDQPELISQ